MESYLKVARASDIGPGKRKLVEVNGRVVALFNLGGSYYALRDVCTHDGGALAEGDLIGDEIECPRHGARFDIRTGEATRMPAFEPVETYRVKVEGDDILIYLD